MSPVPAVPAVTIVVPTYNERGNVTRLIEAVRETLHGESWELLFVDDDSPDGTGLEVARHAAVDGRIRRLRRIGRRGLASACIEGMLASTAPYVAVMDADAQHDPRLLPRMLEILRERRCDVVVASRGDTAGREQFRSGARRWLTRIGNAAGRFLSGNGTADPLSGYFMVRREVVEERAPRLYGGGFKILLDLLSASTAPLAIVDVPMVLRPRAAGDSKLGWKPVIDYAFLLAHRFGGRMLSPRFAAYCAVGLSGLGVHLLVLRLAYAIDGGHFLPSQALATVVAMTSNFFLNNVITFRDRMLRGRALARGLLSYYAACSAGALISVAVGQFLFSLGVAPMIAGASGAVMAAIWNFALNAALTWRVR